jgi:hypothetical protein
VAESFALPPANWERAKSADNGPKTIHTLQQEIDDLRAQAMLLPPGRMRTRALARVTALEVSMKAYSLVGAQALQPPRPDTD